MPLLGVECLHFDSLTADPSSPDDGTLWFNSTAGQWKRRVGGATVVLDDVHQAAVDPTANDDGASGFYLGQVWVNTAADTVWICADTTTSAAVWKDLTASGGSSDPYAIHDNVAGEISALTAKSLLVEGDHLILEDSAAANAKKRAGPGAFVVHTNADPTVNDDTTQGNFVGQIWVRDDHNKAWVCTQNTTGVAQWRPILDVTTASGTDPGSSHDGAAGYEIGQIWVNTSQSRVWICRWNGTGAAIWQRYHMNVTASIDPGSSHDGAAGYYLGQVWINTTADSVWVCTDTATSAAVWNKAFNAWGLSMDNSTNHMWGLASMTWTPRGEPTHAEGLMWYDNDRRNLALKNEVSNLAHYPGREVYLRARNTTGATISAGSPVYISGHDATNDLPLVSLAQANALATSGVVGLACAAGIANNANGYVMVQGLIDWLNTTAYSNGDSLWLSPTVAGGYQNTQPTGSNYRVRLGFVAKSASPRGHIMVILGGDALQAPGDVVGPASATANAIARYNGTTGKLIASSGVTISATNNIVGAKTLVFDSVYNNGTKSAGFTIAWSNGQKQRVTLAGTSMAITFTAPAGPGNFLLVLTQDGTGSRTVTWPATAKWPGGTAPVLSTPANSVDIISFFYDGTNYYGQIAKAFS